MPNITEGAVRQALKRVEKSRKQETLTDGEGRGTGRLALILKPMPTRVTAEWMVQQWRDGKRTKSKIGSYPMMSLSEAREIFKRDFAEVIQKGSSIKIAGDARAGTVADLFEAYVKNLKDAGKSSWSEAEKGLNKIADVLGRKRLARDITPDDVLGVIRPIYERGKLAMADHVRSYIRSAYSWGIKSEYDYRNASPRRFKLVSNPAGGIHLSEFLNWNPSGQSSWCATALTMRTRSATSALAARYVFKASRYSSALVIRAPARGVAELKLGVDARTPSAPGKNPHSFGPPLANQPQSLHD
jgi:hypothetical protein